MKLGCLKKVVVDFGHITALVFLVERLYDCAAKSASYSSELLPHIFILLCTKDDDTIRLPQGRKQ